MSKSRKNVPPRRGRFIETFTKNKKVKELLEFVSADKDLDAQLRDGYIDIYFDGGNILKIEERVRKDFHLSFDKYYFYDDTKTGIPKTYIQECLKKINPRPEKDRKSNYPSTEFAIKINEELNNHQKNLLSSLDNGDYKGYFTKLKAQMSPWIENHGRIERKKQHDISCSNREFTKDNNLVVLDIEFAVSKLQLYNNCTNSNGNKKVPKIDIVAVNREGQIYCIELKNTNEADKEDSPQNIKAHKEDFDKTVGNICKENDFTIEMAEVLEQKQKFKLIGKDIFINTDLNPIFAIAFSGENPNDIAEFNNKYSKDFPIVEICKTQKDNRNYLFLNLK